MFASKMHAVCFRYIGTRADAQDILHEGFIKIFDQIASYNGSGSLEGWIRRIFVNTSLNYLRSQKKMIFSNLEDGNELADSSIGLEEGNTELDNFRNLSKEEILAAVAELDDEHRIIFNMACLENYSHKEISEALNIKETTSRSKLRRARESLKKKLETINRLKHNRIGELR